MVIVSTAEDAAMNHEFCTIFEDEVDISAQGDVAVNGNIAAHYIRSCRPGGSAAGYGSCSPWDGFVGIGGSPREYPVWIAGGSGSHGDVARTIDFTCLQGDTAL